MSDTGASLGVGGLRCFATPSCGTRFVRVAIIWPGRGASVGYIDGHPIAAAVVDDSGHRYSFAGIAPRRADGDYDVQALRRGEWIVEPGLVYA